MQGPTSRPHISLTAKQHAQCKRALSSRSLGQVICATSSMLSMSNLTQQFCTVDKHALRHFCRVERQRAEEVQAALQRAQQHILDLQEQHRLDLESCKQSHAAEKVHLRSDCYSFQNDLAEARQAPPLPFSFPAGISMGTCCCGGVSRGVRNRFWCVQRGKTRAHQGCLFSACFLS